MTYEQRQEIKAQYNIHLPLIIQTSKENPGGGVSPYMIYDWCSNFSPIETDAWNSIRGLGIPLYPEFPVLNYFIDFANPYLKIGVEVDGKDWHDLDKDKKRDLELVKIGWKIFRLTGSECVKIPREYCLIEDDLDYELDVHNEMEDLFMNTSEGFFTALKKYYFTEKYEGDEIRFEHLIISSLDKHRIVKFDLE